MKTFKLLVFCLTIILMYGCGSSGDSTTERSMQVTAPSKGVFTDSPVAGIFYQTSSLRGITDAHGEFQYYPGETVTFSIGDVLIGSAPARPKLTPIELSFVMNDRNPKTINIARFLQSLDSDGNHDNGIQITPEIRAEMAGRKIDFSKNTADFNDSDMQAIFTSLNSKGVFSNAAQRNLIDELTAQYNFRRAQSPSANPFDGSLQTHYTYPVPGSMGGTISISGYRDEILPLPTVTLRSENGVISIPSGHHVGDARIAISGPKVTFEPVTGVSVEGTISNSGIITIPARTTQCKDYYGESLVLSSKLILNIDGSIHGEWWIGAPDMRPGYCYPYLVKAAFSPPLLVSIQPLSLMDAIAPPP